MPIMPCFRGINLCIVGQADVRRFPEFPHPDASSISLGSLEKGTVDQQGPPNLRSSRRSSSSYGSADTAHTPIQKSNPTMSVYIPSQPGVQFWVKYQIVRPPPEHAHLYFKMHINGRHITSWGMNPHVSPTGYVVRAFYNSSKPKKAWRGTGRGPDSGVAIEGRHFCFTRGPEKTSIADDGGVIEFKVFRAKARKLRPIQLELYRDQEVYGISAPRGEALKDPDSAGFYDWYITDPKDSPYATFRFHYRSWSNLQKLNIIPPSLSRDTISNPLILYQTTGIWKQHESALDNPNNDPKSDPNNDSNSDNSFCFGSDFPTNNGDGVVCDDTGKAGSMPVRSSSLRFDSHPMIPPVSLNPATSMPIHIQQPSKAIRDASSRTHPLPVLQEMPDIQEDCSGLSSTSSSTFSIAASLMEYADSPIADDELIEIGVARRLTISRHAVPPFTSIARRRISTETLEKEEPTETVTHKSHQQRRPASYSPTRLRSSSSENFTLASTKRSEMTTKGASSLQKEPTKPKLLKKQRSFSESRSKALCMLKDAGDFLGLSKMSKVKLSESEWMKRGSSPTNLQRSSPAVAMFESMVKGGHKSTLERSAGNSASRESNGRKKENQPERVLKGEREKSRLKFDTTTTVSGNNGDSDEDEFEFF